MGSFSSKSPRFRLQPSIDTPRTPRLPQELLDEIMDHLADDPTSLRRCSMVARTFVSSCRRHLFRRIEFWPHNLPTWKCTFPDPSTSPAAYTREIRIQLASDAPTLLADYMPYFSTRGSISCRLNVRKPFKCLRRIASRSWVRSPDKTNHKRIREPSTKKLAFDIAKLVDRKSTRLNSSHSS